jgi:heme-degrading monooxygenase HmoA
MILRVLRGRVHAHRHGEFNAEVASRMTTLAAQPGLQHASFARRLPDAVQEFVFVTQWEDMNALYRWVGPDLDSPRLFRDREDLLIDYHVEHFEVVAGIVEGHVLDAVELDGPG